MRKLKWDIGYSLVMDRWQNGCKMNNFGAGAPAGGSAGDVYVRNIYNYRCYINDSVVGWVDINDSRLTNATRSLAMTNYPGYIQTPLTQTVGYNTCQQRSPSGVVDGNGNARLRLPMLHEFVMARAAQGTNVNHRSVLTMDNVYNARDLPNNGSCNTSLGNSNSSTFLDGVVLPHPATPLSTVGHSSTITGANLTRNCYSRYEISNLFDAAHEWTSGQYFVTGAGNGQFIQSGLNPNDNLIEGFMTNGVMGLYANPYQTWDYRLFEINDSNSGLMIPMFGLLTKNLDAALGSRYNPRVGYDYGQTPSYCSSGVAIAGNLHGIRTGEFLRVTTARYSFNLNGLNSIFDDYYQNEAITSRCVGQVSP